MQRDHLPGIGCVFSADAPYFGADFDHCCNPDTGEISSDVLAILAQLDTYPEVSPSGTGLHAIGQGVMPDDHKGRRNDDKDYECDGRLRYFTITGDHFDSSPLTIEPRQDALGWHIATHYKPQGPKTKQSQPVPSEPLSSLSNEAIVARALQAKHGEKFGQLYAGSQLHYPTASHADQAHCDILVDWTKDREQIDRLFRSSGRLRAKWERADYRAGTIAAALKYVSEGVGGDTARRSVITLRLAVRSSPPRISGQFRDLTADACIAQNLGLLDSDTGEAACVMPGHEAHQAVVFVSRNFVSRNEDVLYHFPLVMVHNRRSR
jgi:putative DNA primase/helicase